MKAKIFLLCFASAMALSLTSQDIIDPYSEDVEGVLTGYQAPTGYEGEYSFFLSPFFWTNENLGWYSEIRFKIELVSFPFVPDCFDIESDVVNCMDQSDDRDLIILSEDYYTNNLTVDLIYGGGYEVNGTGWGYYDKMDLRENPKQAIFSATDYMPLINNDNRYNSLITHAYDGGFASSGTGVGNRIVLPHSILKHTIYYFYGSYREGDKACDSISWVYDNTRGRMSYYPFINTNSGGQQWHHDITFFPHIEYNPDDHFYDDVSNNTWFQTVSDLGSINYHKYMPCHFNVSNICDWFKCPDSPSQEFLDYNNSCRAIPPYALMSASAFNGAGVAYAGYNNNGGLQNNMIGAEHTYTIDKPIDLRKFNRKEKILYNPSEVVIDIGDDEVLEFPSCYKFLTVHGRYPDKQDVIDQNTHNYSDLTKVLVETDQETSRYILESGTVKILPRCTIMDAVFEVHGGTFIYNPNRMLGNWEVEDHGGEIIEINFDYAVVCGQHAIQSPLEITEDSDPELIVEIYPNPVNDHLRIDFTSNSELDLNEVDISVFSLLGELVYNNSNSEPVTVINTEEWSNGIYFVTLFNSKKNTRIYSKRIIVQ